MPINPISFANTPQATTDLFLASSTGLTEDSVTVVLLDVMANDLGGAAKSLYSLDNGVSAGGASPTDLLVQDTGRTEALSTDTSLAGARIWITSDGKVGYDTSTLSPTFAAQLQALNEGQVLTDSFTYAIRMGNGTLSWATATVQFAGRNDAPTVSGAVLGSAVEDGRVTTLDALANAHDVDNGSVLSVVNVPSTLPPGVTYDPATHSFSLDPSVAAYQHLAADQVQPVTVVYGVSDGTATTQASVTFNVVGANDAATIGTPTVAAVTEDAGASNGMLSATGTIAVTDVDDGESAFHTTVTPAAGVLGSLSLAADGSYTYSVANADVQFLGAGETQTDKFTVTSIDGTSKEVSFTITGVNDAAVIGTPTVAGVTEDAGGVAGNLAATGTISITDADQHQSTFQTAVSGASGNLGSLSLAADGNYTYSVANAGVQFLGAGETQVDKFTVTSFDGTTKEVSFTITGVNDAAVIGDPTAAGVTEDSGVIGSNLNAAGSISISDADQHQSTFQTAVSGASGNLGSLSLAADGSYSYSVANAGVQFLGAGETQVDKFTVTSFDGTTKEVSFTITGVNDAAVIGDPTAAGVTEDSGVIGSNLNAAGSISISDADQHQSTFQTAVSGASGNLGSLSLAADGNYSYSVANSGVQFLGAGETQVDKFTVTSFDGTTKDVSFTITGVNDAAVIGDPTAAAVTEDAGVVAGNLAVTGSISISDADQHQSTFQTAVSGASGNLGSLSLAADGNYSYSVANSGVQFLGAGETQVDKFTVTSFDGTTKDVSFTITGVNDAAVIGDPTAAAVTEDSGVTGGNLDAAGSISLSDADQNQSTFQTAVTSASGNLGSLSLAADGNYTYSVANAGVQFLGAGETQVDKFTVASLDGTTKEVSFTINGANDAAVIGNPTSAAVTEDVGVSGGNLATSGTISISDADQNQSLFQTTVTGTTGNLGSLALVSDGSYTYSVANTSVQFLGAGQTQVDKFTVSSVDGTTKEVGFTVNGANDAAVIGDPTSASVTEDVGVSGGNLGTSGTIAISDADQGQSTFQTAVSAATGNLGSLTLASDGSYAYSVANASVQFLGAGETQVDKFTVTAFDGTTKDVSFTIAGANDMAVIGDPTAASVTEDTNVSGLGQLTAVGTIAVADADQHQAAFNTAVTGTTGNLGSLALAADGSYTYSVANASVQYLGATDTKVDQFTVAAVDGTSKLVSFTIHGANDAATIGTPTVGTVTEDVAVTNGQLSAAGTIPITDTDQNQSAFQTTVTAGTGALGALVLNADGSYVYNVANAATQSLGATDVHTDNFTVTALDGTTHTVSFTIQGANDVAVITGVTSASVQEDTGVVNGQLVTGPNQLTASDADAGQSGFQAQASTAGTYGTFSLTAAGAWTYSVSNSLAAVQNLNTGQSLTDGFTATSSDGSASTPVTVTIQGQNDGLVGTGQSDTYTFAASGTGSQTITDPGGSKDEIDITGSAPLATLGFERLANDLQIQVNNQAVTVVNHFAGTGAVEQITFSAGQSFAGYALAGTYSLFSGSGFVASSGNSNDVVAGTSVGQTLDGGGGASGRDLLFGNGGNDTLIGQNNDDLLVGGAGDDVLQGGDGNDVLVGGAGSDLFVFNTALSSTGNVDHIADFDGNADLVQLAKGGMGITLATPGGATLQAADFFAGTGPALNSVGAAHVIYDTATGNLYYDANGGGTDQRTLFATLDPAGVTGAVTAADFRVVS